MPQRLPATGRDRAAVVQLQFNALHGRTRSYKAFHKQLAKPEFAAIVRALFDLVVGQWAVRTLRPAEGLAGFERVVIQDGSSFAVKGTRVARAVPGALQEGQPGGGGAARDDGVGGGDRLAHGADRRHGRGASAPAGGRQPGRRAAARRPGLLDVDYLPAVDRAGGHFAVCATAAINPTVRRTAANGRELASLRGRPLKRCGLPKTGAVDLDVVWRRKGGAAFRARLVARWNPKRQAHMLLVTNLPRERVSADQVGQLYRLRWQIELMFKEWKSHANLRAFDTANENVAEGLVWAALAAAVLKRHLAHATQMLRRVEVSTREVAMCARHGLDAVLRILAAAKTGSLLPAVRSMIDYLAHNAKRSHPRRDRRSGRLQFGLEPVLRPPERLSTYL